MKTRVYVMVAALAVAVSGCSILDHAFCASSCGSQSHSSSSLVSFLYPEGKMPPREDTIPELRVPLRVGLAFLPSQTGQSIGELPASAREELMERIKKRFADRKFVSEIVTIPDYYLKNAKGYEGLQGVQRLYNVDIMALVSYDQVAHLDDNSWSLGYVTIVGAYVLKGSRHDITTLIDLAVIDPTSRSLVLRAGGTDSRHGNTTLVEQDREARTSATESFSAATDVMIDNFDGALRKFESDVKDGKANVKIVNRNSQRTASAGGGGGGSINALLVASMAGLLAIRFASARRTTKRALKSNR